MVTRCRMLLLRFCFDEVFDLNARVPFSVSQRALPRIRTVGRIINISSGVARIAVPGLAAYAMTKPDAPERKNGSGLDKS
jgi:hypothetical protein